MPVERSAGNQSEMPTALHTKWHEEPIAAQYTQSPLAPPLASLGMTTAAAPLPTPEEGKNPFTPPVESPAAYNAALSPELAKAALVPAPPRPPLAAANTRQQEEQATRYSEQPEQGQAEQQIQLAAMPASPRAPDNALLLDIMQSLPPMSSPPPQPQQTQAHNGRATRSLGSVLLEGHLVPQSRLEVAQGIQRMLSGVDMNYQLGEILLMFKLLTPDQLLAASLVSYGLITTTQISALGRIRQELHSIGLEYDLESLVILFRILTSEQLREVRTVWSG